MPHYPDERLAAEAADKAEQERLAAIAVADLKRLAAEAADKAEEKRLAAEAVAKAEAERLAAEAADTAEEPRFVTLPELLRASTSMRALNLRQELRQMQASTSMGGPERTPAPTVTPKPLESWPYGRPYAPQKTAHLAGHTVG